MAMPGSISFLPVSKNTANVKEHWRNTQDSFWLEFMTPFEIPLSDPDTPSV